MSSASGTAKKNKSTNPIPSKSSTNGGTTTTTTKPSKPPSSGKNDSNGNNSGGGRGGGGGNKPNAWSKPLKTSSAKQQQQPASARHNAPTPPPGYKAQDADANGMTPSGGETVPPNSHKNRDADPAIRAAHRERALHLWLNLVGTKVILHLKDKTIVEGIFHTATPLPLAKPEHRNKYVLKQVRVLEDEAGANTEIVPGSTLVVDMDHVVQLHVKSLPKAATLGQRSNSNNFTDTEISGAANAAAAAAEKRAKELEEAGAEWTSAPHPSPPASSSPTPPVMNSRAEALGAGSASKNNNIATFGNAAAATSTGLSGSIGGWDQFKANETLFNVKGSYDEKIYTTELKKEELSRSAILNAERLAKEIEGTASTNWHVAEERNQKVQGDYDEEDLYSGVLPAAKPESKSTTTKTKMTTTPAVVTPPVAPAPSSGTGGSGTLSYAKVAKALTEEKDTTEQVAVIEEKAKPAEKGKTEENKVEVDEEKTQHAVIKEPSTVEKPAVVTGKGEMPTADAEVKEIAAEEAKSKSKLNANAKEFTLNINAKSFTPKSGGSDQPPPADAMPPHPVHLQQPPPGGVVPYMGQPRQGMMSMMAGPAYVRYPGAPYPGMEHHMPPQMQQQQAQLLPHTPLAGGQQATSGTASPVTDGGGGVTTEDEDGGSMTGQEQPQQSDGSGGPPQQSNPQGGGGPMGQQQQQQQQQQHPGMQQQPMPYGMHPSQAAGYYNPQMGMPPRGPVPGYPQHMMAPQMANPVMYRQMYQMSGPHPGMMPGPIPYYGGPNGPMGYPGYAGGGGYDNDPYYGGGRGGGRGGRGGPGRSGRGRRDGGRGRGERSGGRGRYSSHHHNNGTGGGNNNSYGGSGRSTPDEGYRQHHHNQNHPQQHHQEQQHTPPLPQQQQPQEGETGAPPIQGPE